jgi:RNA polymerase sigma-70 factor, ECF subfamily
VDRQNRDNQRFYTLIWPHAAAVLRTARLLSRHSGEADDLAQETLLKAFRAMDRLTDQANIKAWLMTILRNTRIDRLRSPAARKLASLDDLPQDPPAAAAAGQALPPDPAGLAPRELLEQLSDPQIIEAMKDLPEDIRWTLMLVDVEGIDHADVARILEIPVGTVKSRVHRGHRMLHEALLPLAKDRRFV